MRNLHIHLYSYLIDNVWDGRNPKEKHLEPRPVLWPSAGEKRTAVIFMVSGFPIHMSPFTVLNSTVVFPGKAIWGEMTYGCW